MSENHTSISQPPTPIDYGWDWAFRKLTFAMAILCIGVVALLVVQIAIAASPAIERHGTKFFTTSTWEPKKIDEHAREMHKLREEELKADAKTKAAIAQKIEKLEEKMGSEFGVAPQIAGTLYSSILGVAIGTLFGLAVAIFLTQDFLPYKWEIAIKNIVELLAAIPSVVYGLWGIFVLIPLIRPPANWLHEHFSEFALFGTRLSGPGLLPAALVLAIMVLPTVTAISRDSLAAVPNKLREAAFGLGAMRWEAITGVILPTASRGIYGSIILAFGRAVGETMALAMLFGNTNTFDWSLFAPGNTLAALLANQWPEAGGAEKSALLYAGLVLLGITLLINIVGTLIIMRTSQQGDPKR